MVPVAYRSPMLIAAFFARPMALCAPQCVERSDQIACEHGRRPRAVLADSKKGLACDGDPG
jgi:hypothetical protein